MPFEAARSKLVSPKNKCRLQSIKREIKVQITRLTSKTFVKRIALLTLCTLFATSMAFASGGGGSGGGSSGGGNGDSITSVSKATYDRGKNIFHENVVCDSCPYADLELTPEAVREVWKQMKKDLHRKGAIGAELKRKERRSVKAFIRKRFKL